MEGLIAVEAASVILQSIIYIGAGLGIVLTMLKIGEMVWGKTKDEIKNFPSQSLSCGFQHDAMTQLLREATQTLKKIGDVLHSIQKDLDYRQKEILTRLDNMEYNLINKIQQNVDKNE